MNSVYQLSGWGDVKLSANEISQSGILKSAIENKDTFKQDLYIARLSYAAPKLELLETNLQKSIISAKYSKVWEFNNHETTRTRY